MFSKLSNFAGPISTLSGQFVESLNLILSLDSGTISNGGSLQFFQNQYLTISSDDFRFGTNDFTIELWFNYTSNGDIQGLITNYYTPLDVGVRLYIDYSGNLTGLIYQDPYFGYVIHENTVTQNEWHHAAVVRQGTTFSVFLDGVQNSVTSGVADINISQNSTLQIGKSFNNLESQKFLGKITNVRVSNTAVYTQNFTPSTEQFQSNGSTTLLLLVLDENSLLIDSNTDLPAKTLTSFSVISFNSSTPITKSYIYSKIWPDNSGNGRDFTFDQNPIIINEFGKSIYITSGNYASGSDFGSLSKYTLDIWVNFKTIVPSANVFTNIWDSNPQNINMFLGNFWVPNYGVLAGSYAGDNNFKTSSVYDVSTSRWYNFVVTFDKESNVSLYVNGETYSITNVSPYKPKSSGLGYLIGKKWKDDQIPVPSIDANVSIINVWNGALTYSTINQNYNNLLDRFYFNLHLDNFNTFDASGSNIYDLTNNLPGTVSGILFDSSYDGCLVFGETSSINFGNPEPLNQNGDLSIFTWIKFNQGWNTAYHVIFDHYGGSPNDIYFSVKPDPAVEHWYMNIYTQNNYGLPGNEYGGIYDTTELSQDVWYHLGFTLENGGDLSFYIDGILSSTYSNITRNRADLDAIIGSSSPNNGLKALMGEFRLYNRVLSGEEVLNYFNNTKDRYSSGTGSLVFNGSNSWYEIPASSDLAIGTNYTIEFWSKSNSSSVGHLYTIMSQRDSDSSIDIFYQEGNLVIRNGSIVSEEPTPGIWTHVAIVSDSSAISVYYNGLSQSVNVGVSGGNLQDSTHGLAIGRRGPANNFQYFDGQLFGIRINNTVVYNSEFYPYDVSLPPTNISGTILLLNNYRVTTGEFIDTSFNQTLINHGVTYSNILPERPGSFRFGLNDTTERWIQLAASNDWVIGTGDFSIEWFQYQTQASPPSYSRLFQIGDYPNHSLAVSIESGTFLLWLNSGNTYYVAESLSNYLNQWVHFAVSRNSGQVSVWINGTRVWYNAVYTNINNNSSPFKIGSGTGNVWNGYLTNFRLVTGQSAYTDSATITVPTSTLTDVPGTKLLLLFNSPQLVDSSQYDRTVTNYGATWSTLSPFS